MLSSRIDWLRLVYGADLAGGAGRIRHEIAARLLAGHTDLIDDDPHLACAVGNEAVVRRAIDSDPLWPNRAGGPLHIAPLIAVTHSALVKLREFREPILGCARLLLERGADANSSYFNRAAPHSLEHPGDEKLTAIFGAAGKLHDEALTAILLEAGADPNDNESLYHSRDDPRPELPCTRLLLEGGARVPGSNALAKVLDSDNLQGLEMLLAHTGHGDPDLGRILHWAIYRGRSAAHVRALLDAGADPKALDQERRSAFQHAASFGLPEVMRLLEQRGTGEPLTDAEKFVSACARADADEAHRAASAAKLQRLLEQRADLAGCLDTLLADAAAGRAYFKVYRQFKMYNDPRFNPVLVAERARRQQGPAG